MTIRIDKTQVRIGKLFTPGNYCFSTKAEGRKETLYFMDQATGRTRRLRQQHPKGPVAKIDREPRVRRFLSKKRFEHIRKWHREHKHALPRFYAYEKQPNVGKYHLEFSCDGRKVSDWHPSGGTVNMSEQNIKRRIDHALEEVLGIGCESVSARKS